MLWNIDAYNSYGLSELNGPGVAFECVYKNDMHLWEDGYIVEIIDPDTGEQVRDGDSGEVVLTNLIRRATPMLRYRTRDLAYLHTDPCPCGRTHRRLSRIMGRTDDMLIINGINVFPSQIEEVVMRIPEVATNYIIQVEKHGDLDHLTVKVEIYPETVPRRPVAARSPQGTHHRRAAFGHNPASVCRAARAEFPSRLGRQSQTRN